MSGKLRCIHEFDDHGVCGICGYGSKDELTTLRERVKELELLRDGLVKKLAHVSVQFGDIEVRYSDAYQQNALLTLEAKRLREALKWLCMRCEDQGHYSPTRQPIVVNALSTPLDTSALDAYVAGWKKDAELLTAIQSNSWDLRCVNLPTGGDDYEIGWHVFEHHMQAPCLRLIGEDFNDSARNAIAAAIAAQEGK